MNRIYVEGRNPNQLEDLTQDWVRTVSVDGNVAVAHSVNRANGHKEHRGTIEFVHFSEIECSVKDFVEYKEEQFF